MYDMEGMARVMYDSWLQFSHPVALCLDHSKFDGHYCTQLLDLEHQYWNKCYKSKYLKWLLKQQIHNRGKTQAGLRYKMNGHRASGEYTTSEGNGLTNYLMIISFLQHNGVSNARVHVNGDDSVIIVDMKYVNLVEKLDYFRNFNMETEADVIAYDFRKISYCQMSPIRHLSEEGDVVYTMVKAPFRTMSRMSYSDIKYKDAINRYISGIALCELAFSRGIPIVQDFCSLLLSKSGLSRPVAGVDKFPARLSGSRFIRTTEILSCTREDFAVAFDIPIEQQIAYENSLVGQLVKDAQSITSFLTKYQFFHLQ